MFRIVILAVALLSLPALARDNGQWGNRPAALRQWFQNLMQPDNQYLSCCGEADAYEADSFAATGEQLVASIPDVKTGIPNGWTPHTLEYPLPTCTYTHQLIPPH